MNRSTLFVDSVSAGYVRGMPIIRDVSIIVNPEEIVCIVGPNGAGKSTLLKSIIGLLTIEHGSISLGNSIISGIRPDTLSQKGVAFVPQLDNIFRTMSVEQNLALAARRCRANKKQRMQDIACLFPVLEDKFMAKAGSLSGGQRQLLAIGMALIAEPTLLLLDEPSAGLSPKAASEVLGMLQGIADSGVAVLMVEQNVKAALRISDRAYVLAEGQNQYESDAKSLLNDPVLGEIYLGARRKESHAADAV
ncbi:MAG: ABC transporter ATP-binding protein [Granulosicoccus sp.]